MVAKGVAKIFYCATPVWVMHVVIQLGGQDNFTFAEGTVQQMK